MSCCATLCSVLCVCGQVNMAQDVLDPQISDAVVKAATEAAVVLRHPVPCCAALCSVLCVSTGQHGSGCARPKDW
jgi:hypothetical protein